MFTGIVEELGRVAAIQALPDNAIRITIEGPTVLSDANLGDSICVNGVCLTVAEQNGDQFTADVMSETINRTSFGVAAILLTLSWLGGEIASYMKLRIHLPLPGSSTSTLDSTEEK